jgi:hypothetical protein
VLSRLSTGRVLSIAFYNAARFLGLVMSCFRFVRWRIVWRGFSCLLVAYMSSAPAQT